MHGCARGLWLGLTLLVLACGEDPAPPSYAEFLAELPDAVCDYYLSCGQISASERAACPDELHDDIERDYACNAARGLYQDLVTGLGRCVDGSPKACAKTDDLDLFCPSLSLLEDSCEE